MPPPPRKIRQSNFLSSVHALDAPHLREIRKPYIPQRKNNHPSCSTQHNEKTEQNIQTSNKFMDLDEFLQHSDKRMSSTINKDDNECPKPNVDLLASLLTLGKMIQNQKQLIQNRSNTQTSSNDSPSTLTSPPFESGYSIGNEDSIIKLAKSKELEYKQATETHSLQMQETQLQSSSVQLSSSFAELSSSGQSTQSQLYVSDQSNLPTTSKKGIIPEEIKDIDYWDRRKRNNMAAKKSREERRKKELEVLDTTKQLEVENSQLTVMLKKLTSRNEWLELRLSGLRERQVSNAVSSVSSSADDC